MIDVKLLSGALGAEISGINLKDSSKEYCNKINHLVLEHNVLFFRNHIGLITILIMMVCILCNHKSIRNEDEKATDSLVLACC